MHKVHQRRQLQHTPEQLYQLVGDIERYAEFLPWCKQVKIIRRRDAQCDARVTVSFKGIRQTYQCRVHWNAKEQTISVTYLSGALANLSTRWAFHATDNPKHCIVDFQLDFTLRNRLFSHLMDQMMLKAIERITDAFVARAHVLYGA